MRRFATRWTVFLALAAPRSLWDQAPASHLPSRPPIDSLEARARADSNDAVVHYELAMGYWRLKRMDEADRELHQALALAPQYAEAYLALSAIPMARGEKYWKKVEKSQGRQVVAAAFEARERDYRRAFLLNPMVDLGILGRIDERGDLSYGQYRITIWWLGTFKKGINQFLGGDYEQARARFNEVLLDARAGPQGGGVPEAVLWYRGLSSAHLHRYDEAVEDFAILTGRAVAEARADTIGAVPLRANDYRYVLATMLFLAGRYDQAAPTFRRALEFDIALFPAHILWPVSPRPGETGTRLSKSAKRQIVGLDGMGDRHGGLGRAAGHSVPGPGSQSPGCPRGARAGSSEPPRPHAGQSRRRGSLGAGGG